MQVLRKPNPGLRGLPQDLITGANALNGKSNLEDASWPYFWSYPRENCELVQKVKSIAAPAAGVLTLVTDLIVPPGFVFILRGIRQTFQTGTGGAPVFTEGSGDILWTLDVDVPITTGSIPLSGYSLPDMGSMADMRGSSTYVWPIEGFNVFEPYQHLRYKVITTGNIPSGAPNYITCGLFGWWDKAL